MHPKRLVVVGGVAAGMSAASRARRIDPDLEILVFERSGYVSYGACGLPYYVGGLVGRVEDLVVYTPEFFREKRRIDVRVHHEVTAIDVVGRTVTVRRLGDRTQLTFGWDRLVLATGAYATRPSVPGIERPGVFTLRTLEDGVALRAWLDGNDGARAPTGHARKAVLVGAGPLNLELAENLRRREVEVSLLELTDQVLPGYEPALAELVRGELERNGVAVFTGERLGAVLGTGRDGPVEAVETGSGRVVPADVVVLGTGVRPRVELARAAGIRLGESGAVAVDEHLRTSAAGVYAAGDGVETWHRVLKRPVWIPLGTTANKMGRVAGENAAGGDTLFRGVVGTAALRAFDVEVGRTGLTLQEAKKEGFDAVSVYVRHGSRAHYYPGSAPVHVWMVGDRQSGRLLGAQMLGPAGSVAKRMDVLAVAVTAEMEVGEVAELDLSYAPPFAPVWEPVLMAARQWLKEAGLPGGS